MPPGQISAPSDSQPVAPDRISAAQIGRYAIMDRAGAGAMGVVYAAYDPSLDRRVALKVLRSAANRGRARDRVRREAIAMARLNHPNVASIYEVGEADGRLFIAMEYVDGPTLKAWLADTHDWRAILDTFIAVGRGLAAAHAQGLAHRDFKPANVLVGDDGRPRVIDFGLARAVDAEAPEAAPSPLTSGELQRLSSDLTRTGRVGGTPAYMAPELMAGDEPTAASDQFAFCVALFEALYGHPPYPRDSLPMLRLAMQRGEIQEPDGERAPPEVLVALRRGLDADPAARWPTLAALVDALNRIEAFRPDLARGTRRRLWIGAVSLAALALLIVRHFVKGPPTSAFEVVKMQLTLLAVASGVLIYYRKWFAIEGINRRLRQHIILIVGLRLLISVTGARMHFSVDQLFAVDAIAIIALLAVVEPLIGLKVRAFVGVSVALFVAILIAPAATLLLHHIIGGLMMLGLLHGEWRARRIQWEAGTPRRRKGDT